jgi:tRNA threonylcarbamoyladenosine biosynthesis protein TsaB
VTLLALDTATRATTVALCAPGAAPVEARDDPRPGERPRHATHLLPLAAGLLGQAGLDFSDVERIAVGVGPGTFTGLRIGLATARALAQARAIPLVAVSTAASLALGAWGLAVRESRELVVAAIDARRGEVFAAVWRVDREADPTVVLADPGGALIGPRAWRPEELAGILEELGRSALAAGDGAVAFRAAIDRSGALIPDDGSELHRVAATNHCRLAARLHDSAPGEVVPAYLRLPDAELGGHRNR